MVESNNYIICKLLSLYCNVCLLIYKYCFNGNAKSAIMQYEMNSHTETPIDDLPY